jgi:hypothetical protein
VLGLFVRVQPGCLRRPRQRHDRVPVLARVARQLLAGQIAPLPADVERMLEHVPPLARRVDPCDHVHLGSSRLRPRRTILAREIDRGGPAAAHRETSRIPSIGSTGHCRRARGQGPRALRSAPQAAP